MMKPKFDDVLEYVRAGEVDPEMSEVLDLHPDGQELLKQARFICKALRERYGKTGGSERAFRFGDASKDIGRLSTAKMSESLEAPAPREARGFYQSASLSKPRRKRSPSLDRMLSGIDSERQDLGTLRFAVDEKRLSASYEPSAAVASYTKKFGSKVPNLQLGLLGVQIRAEGINISLAEAIAVGTPVTLQLSSGLRQMPARYLDLVFMPDAGPFVRFESDEDGSADLLEPIQSGILRIEADVPQFLRIKVEKS